MQSGIQIRRNILVAFWCFLRFLGNRYPEPSIHLCFCWTFVKSSMFSTNWDLGWTCCMKDQLCRESEWEGALISNWESSDRCDLWLAETWSVLRANKMFYEASTKSPRTLQTYRTDLLAIWTRHSPAMIVFGSSLVFAGVLPALQERRWTTCAAASSCDVTDFQCVQEAAQ